jgi:hypothetical protein
MKPKRLIEALVVHIARLVDGSIAHGAEGGVRVHPSSLSNPDRVSIQAHTSLVRAALARMPLRVSTFISPPDADAVWR